jgi:hypothetical protein
MVSHPLVCASAGSEVDFGAVGFGANAAAAFANSLEVGSRPSARR